MFSKKFICLVIIAAIILNIFAPNCYAQKKRVVKKKSVKVKTYKKAFSKKTNRKKIISGGVMNGKARNLVKPQYPSAAKLVNARGTVAVEVLIDENGKVIEAKALRGHPLLIANSIKAAKLSEFEPFILESGEALKVRGVIFYNYLSDRINWLEIGYTFEVPNYIYTKNLENYLPAGFDEERQLLTQLKLAQSDRQTEILQSVSSSIENKLSSDGKNLWLFAVGKEIGNLSNSYWNDRDATLDKIQNYIYTAPAGISPVLIKTLENLLSASKNDAGEFNKTLVNLVERLSGLGN